MMYSIFSSIQSLSYNLVQQVSRSFSKITPHQLKIMAAVSIGFAVLGGLIYSALQSSKQIKGQQQNPGDIDQKTQAVFQQSQGKKLETPEPIKQPSPDMDFVTIFKEIREKTDQSIELIPFQKHPQVEENCRFGNILCPRATLVKLPGTSDDHYLHANHVELEGQHFIAAQYPVVSRWSMFWSLCEQVSLVIDLTNGSDMQKIIDAYYPEEDSTEEQEYGDFLLKCEKRKDLEGINASVYTYHVKNKNEQKAKNSDEPQGFHVDRLHYKGWRDHLGITEDDLDQIIAVIESYKDADKPVVVHCRAGVGRTGVVVVAYALADLIKRKKINESNLMDHIKRLILEGRTKRGEEFVQTEEQLEALWKWSWRRLHLANIKPV